MVTAYCALKPSIQKQKPRNVPLLNKADWPKLKSLMRDYQKKFLLEHPNRSVEELWSDLVTALDTFSSKCIPSKIIRGKFSLHWITQNIRRQIRRRDDLYRKLKKNGDQKFRDKFLSLRTNIKHKIKASYNLYLEGLLDITDENSVCNNKKLFSFLKSAKQDQTGSHPLQDDNGLVTDTTEKNKPPQPAIPINSNQYLLPRHPFHFLGCVRCKSKIWQIVVHCVMTQYQQAS